MVERRIVEYLGLTPWYGDRIAHGKHQVADGEYVLYDFVNTIEFNPILRCEGKVLHLRLWGLLPESLCNLGEYMHLRDPAGKPFRPGTTVIKDVPKEYRHIFFGDIVDSFMPSEE